MKRIAVFIALGSIIAGIIVWFWPPEPCESGAFLCLNGLTEILTGLFISVMGIALLPLIALANSRHYALALLGVVTNFGCAILLIVCSIGLVNLPADPKFVDLFISIAMAVEAVGFFCAGLPGLFENVINIKKPSLDDETNSPS